MSLAARLSAQLGRTSGGLSALVLVLVLAACTKTETTLVGLGPPSAADLPGSYAAAWGGPAGLLGSLIIESDGAFRCSPYPCLASSPDLGGSWEYDPNSGDWTAEGKTLDGSAKAVLALRFTAELSAAGSYQVLVLATPCASGPLALTRTP